MTINSSNQQTTPAWALILGGSGAFGLAAARKLAASGYHLILIHKDRKSVLQKKEPVFQEIRDQFKVQLHSFNQDAVASESITELISSIRRILEEQGGSVQVLIHAIARGNLKPLTTPDTDKTQSEAHQDMDEEESLIRRFFEMQKPELSAGTLSKKDLDLTIHAMGSCLLDWVQQLLETGLLSRPGRIISLTSEGDKKVWPSYAAVASAKSVLESLTRYLAVELAPAGITVNMIQAGVTDTESLRMIPGSEFLKKYTRERNPAKRLTTPEDVANVVYLLCREEAAWITGSTIMADGGEHLV